MLTRILVAIDFSAPSDAALTHARTLAESFDASLHLLHVLEPGFFRPVADAARLESVTRRLDERLTSHDRRSFRVASTVRRSDQPADEIATYARVCGADLIVMGTHGRSGVSHMLMGSVAEKVLRIARCPVLTVHSGLRTQAAGFRSLLVPTDFSAASDAALDCARIFAARFGAPLRLLHVLDEFGPAPGFIDTGERPAARALRIRDACDRLRHRVSRQDGPQLRVSAEVVTGGAAGMITTYASANGFDLIVMGTHARTGVSHLLLGSVAERVVRTAECAVITTRCVEATTAAMVPIDAPSRLNLNPA